MKLLKVDCSEFPCVTLWNRTGAVEGNDFARLDTCAAWSSVPHDDHAGGSAAATWRSPNGADISVALVAAYPAGWHETHPPTRDPELRKPRFEVRKETIFGDLQADLGARDLTKVEQLEHMVEVVRASGHDDESLQYLVDRLEEARAADAAERTP